MAKEVKLQDRTVIPIINFLTTCKRRLEEQQETKLPIDIPGSEQKLPYDEEVNRDALEQVEKTRRDIWSKCLEDFAEENVELPDDLLDL